MLDFEDGADAFSGRKRMGPANAMMRLLGIAGVIVLLVLTVLVLL